MFYSKSKGYGWKSGHDLLKKQITIWYIKYDPIFCKNFKKIIFGSPGSSLLHVGFCLAAKNGSYPSVWCVGFSLRWLLLW